MLVVTGGAGMLGSILIRHVTENLGRDDVVAVDHFHGSNKWRNLRRRRLAEILDKDELHTWLSKQERVDAVVHLGAVTTTVERDFGVLLNANVRYSQSLWRWCAEREVPMVYASSAMTYGDDAEFDDSAAIDQLRPVNAYAFSKQVFDLWAMRQQREGRPCPPRWYGLKYFTLYGPNEYHKGHAASAALHVYRQAHENGKIELFRSNRPDVADGMQTRDFMHVNDAAVATSHFIEHEATESGLYNVGTGTERSFLDLAAAVFAVMGRQLAVDFIDLPEELRDQYQHRMRARINKLRAANYTHPFMDLETGIADYVGNFLMQSDPYC